MAIEKEADAEKPPPPPLADIEASDEQELLYAWDTMDSYEPVVVTSDVIPAVSHMKDRTGMFIWSGTRYPTSPLVVLPCS
jgi:hypothetical protein